MKAITTSNHDVIISLGLKCHPLHHLGSRHLNQTIQITLGKANILKSSTMICVSYQPWPFKCDDALTTGKVPLSGALVAQMEKNSFAITTNIGNE